MAGSNKCVQRGVGRRIGLPRLPVLDHSSVESGIEDMVLEEAKINGAENYEANEGDMEARDIGIEARYIDMEPTDDKPEEADNEEAGDKSTDVDDPEPGSNCEADDASAPESPSRRLTVIAQWTPPGPALEVAVPRSPSLGKRTPPQPLEELWPGGYDPHQIPSVYDTPGRSVPLQKQADIARTKTRRRHRMDGKLNCVIRLSGVACLYLQDSRVGLDLFTLCVIEATFAPRIQTTEHTR